MTDAPLTYDGSYGGGNGGGDFTPWVAGNGSDAFVAFPYAPRGEVLDTWLARVPLALLKWARCFGIRHRIPSTFL